MKGYMKMMENNLTNLGNINSILSKHNRKTLRKMFGGKRSGLRSKAPRYIASRKVLPMPIGWEGWRNWEIEKKAM